jgi:hypothetical protein
MKQKAKMRYDDQSSNPFNDDDDLEMSKFNPVPEIETEDSVD